MSVNLRVENVTQIKSRITINVGVSLKIRKNRIGEKIYIFRIMLHVLVKMVNIYEVLQFSDYA